MRARHLSEIPLVHCDKCYSSEVKMTYVTITDVDMSNDKPKSFVLRRANVGNIIDVECLNSNCRSMRIAWSTKFDAVSKDIEEILEETIKNLESQKFEMKENA